MSHYDQHMWGRYLQEELDADTSIALEQHLYECDECLEAYTTYLELHPSSIPAPHNSTLLEDSIMTAVFGSPVRQDEQEITSNQPLHKAKSTRMERWRTLRNYLVAAAATIILMVTGIFNGLFKQVDDLKSRTADRQTSISEKLVEQTVSFFNDMQPHDKYQSSN
ncbi:hypothetical protein E0485_22860 [Paenibacillus albiflavus]|uniref:Zinc-finger domain-containing protein n=1 Tax=Paenibacillus albiflavus TaxID=2545760 RepID=A0A4R4DYZ2_9BACL|nr:hypothetical protein [Paenibacillus albiflavus]TCZ71072.1 hypothetical protein E0485_22860 [Paenibacillus albiflavus]